MINWYFDIKNTWVERNNEHKELLNDKDYQKRMNKARKRRLKLIEEQIKRDELADFDDDDIVEEQEPQETDPLMAIAEGFLAGQMQKKASETLNNNVITPEMLKLAKNNPEMVKKMFPGVDKATIDMFLGKV